MKRMSAFASHTLTAALAVSIAMTGCSKPEKKSSDKKKASPALTLNDKATKNEADIKSLQLQVSQKDQQMVALEQRIADIESQLQVALSQQTKDETAIARLQGELKLAKDKLTAMESDVAQLKNELKNLRSFTDSLEQRMLQKLSATSLGSVNKQLIQQNMGKDWKINTLEGSYNVLLIPVEFSDKKFDDREFLATKAQDYLFGKDEGTLSSYYRHASGGRLQVSGTVVPIVTVDKPLAFYGAGVSATEHDKDARQLVVDALKIVRDQHASNPEWWNQFDQWDLNDYDGDGIYHERDGLLDAVVLIYAGKEEASCAAYFPFEKTLNPADPQYAAAIECNNRIWPHRSSIFLPAGNPDTPTTGPSIEDSPIMASAPLGIKITASVHAFDYNMQSEYSDRSTFIHEFGHSLTFPDVYAVNSTFQNGSAYWTVMSQNAKNQAQEMGPLERMMVGWVSPKIIYQGESTSAYVGNTNFVDAERRDGLRMGSDGLDFLRRAMGFNDITSIVPGSDEPVYRAIMAVPTPYKERMIVTAMPASSGRFAAYSTHKDSANLKIAFRANIPADGAQEFSFDTMYGVETETNFTAFSKENSEVKVLTNYDVGLVKINGKLVEQFQTISGDTNGDTLADMNPDCKASDVLALRQKRIDGTVTPAEWAQFKVLYATCIKPYWVHKSYNLANIDGQDLRGQAVDVEVSYVTDGGAGEMGIIVDNVRLGEQTVDFESGTADTGDFITIENGGYDTSYNHFYLLEHRDPTADYGTASYNMDKNIQVSIGFFMPKAEGQTPRDRFRVVDINYQPGVLAWYFNPKFDRRGNTPGEVKNDGEGYYLPVNSKVREVPMPGALGAPELFNAKGEYDATSDVFKAAAQGQRDEFICYGYTAYAKYLFGKDPDCSNFDPAFLDDMKKLKRNDKQLVFNFEGINEYVPHDRANLDIIARPFSGLFNGDTFIRQALAPFRTPGAGMATPFKVWKVAPGTTNLVVDEEMTAAASKYAPANTFADADYTKANAWWHGHPRFLADAPMVHGSGFSFFVADPDSSVTKRFDGTNAAEANFPARSPMSKVYMFWNN